MPRSAVLRSVVMNHLIHYRAQLGVYLPLNDVAIPGIPPTTTKCSSKVCCRQSFHFIENRAAALPQRD